MPKAVARVAPGGGMAGPGMGAVAAANMLPNKILFLENLPVQAKEEMLQTLFQQYPGYSEVRMVPARPGIAFVEFENDMQAATALQGLQGFKLSDENSMKVTFAKR